MKKSRWLVVESGCWEWQGSLCNGYGSWSRNKVRMKAHRAVYEMYRGQIPEGMDLDHLCRNTKCVNPDHLEPVTEAENTRRGLSAKLSVDDVKAIRLRYRRGDTLSEIAKSYGVCFQTIGFVVQGKTWSDVHADLICRDNRSRMAHPKLTDAEVVAIQQMRDATGLSFREIGSRFGVSDEHARRICNGLRRQYSHGGLQ